jgi:hypothetical protein
MKSPSSHTHQVLNQSKQTKNEKNVGLGLERGLQLFFKIKIEAKYHTSASSVCRVAALLLMFQRTFVALQFAHSMTQNLVNLAKELGKYWKVFYDRYMFSDGQFYPSPSFPFLLNQGTNHSPSII